MCFYIIRFHVRSPVRLLYYTVPYQMSSPSFTLYGSMSEVQSFFYIIRLAFLVRSPVRLLHYTVLCHKSSPSFTLYGYMSEVLFVFYIIRFHVRNPARHLNYTVPRQIMSEVFYVVFVYLFFRL
jgi:hypothetical protein